MLFQSYFRVLPLYFSLFCRDIPAGDLFDIDCVHHHTVLAHTFVEILRALLSGADAFIFARREEGVLI